MFYSSKRKKNKESSSTEKSPSSPPSPNLYCSKKSSIFSNRNFRQSTSVGSPQESCTCTNLTKVETPVSITSTELECSVELHESVPTSTCPSAQPKANLAGTHSEDNDREKAKELQHLGES